MRLINPHNNLSQHLSFIIRNSTFSNDDSEVAGRMMMKSLEDTNAFLHKRRIIDISLFIGSEKCARIKLSI